MKYIIRFIIICAGLLLLWQSLVWFLQIPDYLLPSPLQVFSVLLEQYELILRQALPTLTETLLGFLLGILTGCFAGMILAFFRPAAMWFLPLLIISQAVPTFAIAPLLVIWLGYGMT
jgi:putative hydroxymethylpyrimidine transport system permease protein